MKNYNSIYLVVIFNSTYNFKAEICSYSNTAATVMAC